MPPNILAKLLYASQTPAPAIQAAFLELIALVDIAGDLDEIARIRRMIAAAYAIDRD